MMLLLVVSGALATGDRETATTGSEDLDTIVILYPQTVSSIPILALIDQYPHEYAGVAISDHTQALAELISGGADLLASGFAVGFSRYQSAGDLVLVAVPVWGASALMTAEKIGSLADLSGGTIYAPFEGSPIDLHLKAILALDGLTNQVEIAYAPFPQAAALLTEGRAEAAFLVEPIASRLELAGNASRLENVQDGWARLSGGEPRSPQVALFATTSRVEQLGARVELLTNRLAAQVEAVTAAPAEFAQRYAEALGFPVHIVRRAIENTLFDLPSPELTRELVDSYARIMDLPSAGADFFTRTE